MKTELIIDGNAVYEIDMDCMQRKGRKIEAIKKSAVSGYQLMSGEKPTYPSPNILLAIYLLLTILKSPPL